MINVKVIQITTSAPNPEALTKTLNFGFDRVIISVHSMIEATRKHLIPNSMPLQDILELLQHEISMNKKLEDVIRISHLLLGRVNTSDEEQIRFINFASENSIILLLMAYNQVNEEQNFLTDIDVYRSYIRKIQNAQIKYEDCTYSLSRRDPVGGCGTLFVSKIDQQG